MFGQIDRVLGRIEQLSSRLRADPELFVHRSALELRAAFDERRAIEPSIERLRASVRMLRRDNEDGCRREFQRRALSLDRLDGMVEQELLPQLRQVGFDV
jgi:hypothetical protein